MNHGSLLSARMRGTWWVVGMLSVALLALGAVRAPADFFHAYLMAYVFWIGITLGCFIILMIHHLAGGNWGLTLRRVLEAAIQTSPLMAVLLLPLLPGLTTLYPWARPETVANDILLQGKNAYLNVPFFLVRTLLYIGLWNMFIFRAIRWSDAQDASPGPEWALRFRRFSAVALVVFGLTVTFAGIDYLMSLEPHWFSSIYSAMLAAGGVLSGFAFAIVILGLLQRQEPLASVMSAQLLNDIGNLLMAFVMLWAYLAYSQFLIIWSGNLGEETSWYQRRLAGGWEYVALLAVLSNFVLPFALLLVRDIKRHMWTLGSLAAWLVAAQWVNVFWLVKPAFDSSLNLSALDVLALVALGIVWLAVFYWRLAARPVLLRHDPRLVGMQQPAREQA
jgi:hypothetical protein